MVLNKGDEFLIIASKKIVRIYATSTHGTQVVVAEVKSDGGFVVNMNPIQYTEIQYLLSTKRWVPNTPAAQILYLGSKL